MNYRNYLLFTTNYTASMLEVLLLDGILIFKVSDTAFFASLPIGTSKKQLLHSSLTEINTPDKTTEDFISTWFEWDQSFLTLYSEA